jgi:acyl carrier protein
MSIKEIMARTIKVISLKTQVVPEQLQPNTKIDSLGLDSLDLAELEMDLEEEFGIELNITKGSVRMISKISLIQLLNVMRNGHKCNCML